MERNDKSISAFSVLSDLLILLPSANEVCLSFCTQRRGGGCLPSACWGTHPLDRHPPGRHPRADNPPPGIHPRQTPPLQQTATAADDTHPTGMPSCRKCIFQINSNLSRSPTPTFIFFSHFPKTLLAIIHVPRRYLGWERKF